MPLLLSAGATLLVFVRGWNMLIHCFMLEDVLSWDILMHEMVNGKGIVFFFKVLPHWVILENLDLPPLYQNVMIRSEYAGVRKNTPSPNF